MWTSRFCIIGALFLPLTLVIASIAAAAPPPAPVADDFCRALQAGSVEAFEPLSVDRGDLTDTQFESVRDVVRLYDGVIITRCSESRTKDVVEVEGSGLTRNAARQREAIPRHWFLTRSPAAKVLRADDDSHHIAALLIAATNDAERESIAASSPVPLADVARCLVTRPDDAGRDAALFLLSRGGSRHDSLTESYALCALAEIARRANDRAQASRLFEAARLAAASSGSCDAAATAEWLSATIAADERAKRALWEAAAGRAYALRDPQPALRSLYAIGRKFDDLAAMTSYFDRIDVLTNAFHSIDGEMAVNAGRSAAAQVVSDIDGSNRFSRRAIAAAHRAGDAVWESLSWVSIGMNSPGDEGLDAFRRVAALIRHDDPRLPLRAYANAWIGSKLLDVHRLAEAESHVDAALAVPPGAAPWNRVFPLWFIERLRHEQGRCIEAAAAAREAIAIDPNGSGMIWAIESDLAQELVEIGDRDGAIEAYRRSIALIEARRSLSTSDPMVKARYLASRTPIYAALESALLDERRFEEALAVAEQLKARSLADSMRGAAAAPLTADESGQEQRLNQEVVRANEALMRASGAATDAARRNLQTARANLDAFHELSALRHAGLGPSTEPADPADAVMEVRGHSLLAYSIVGDSVVAYVIRDGRVTGRRIASVAAAEATAGRLLEQIAKRDLGYAADAAKLYEQILAPVVDLLPPSGSLVVVPDGFLWRVPFSALRTHDGKFLVERYAISYAPSIAQLQRASRVRRPLRAKNDLLAVGNPRIASTTSKSAALYRGLSLAPIPEAAAEAKAIGALYREDEKLVLTGADATESAVKKIAAKYRIIHLATHGLVDSEAPLYSALVLARRESDADDGLLEMREISALHLNADLVVLSACDTANGAIYPGEGVIGLSWAFMSAGCPTTVVSQWSANSSSTEILMTEFHRQLRRGVTASEALRRAELTVMKSDRFRHPHYWAPFIVIGSDAVLFREPVVTTVRR